MACKQVAVGSVYLARVPRGTDRNGHVSLFVSSIASPTLCGSLYGGARILKRWQSTLVRRFEKIVLDLEMCTLMVGLVRVLSQFSTQHSGGGFAPCECSTKLQGDEPTRCREVAASKQENGHEASLVWGAIARWGASC